jgi:DNA helicase-2/ATP-dependent DNA helicase PcrA
LRPHVARDVATKQAKKKGTAPEAADAELFGRLRAWRKAQAEAQGSPPYIVFSDATLVAIADARPQSTAALARISGVGPMKLERYAEPLLAVLGGADPASVDAVVIS